jgi:hypothetical protein
MLRLQAKFRGRARPKALSHLGGVVPRHLEQRQRPICRAPCQFRLERQWRPRSTRAERGALAGLWRSPRGPASRFRKLRLSSQRRPLSSLPRPLEPSPRPTGCWPPPTLVQRRRDFGARVPVKQLRRSGYPGFAQGPERYLCESKEVPLAREQRPVRCLHQHLAVGPGAPGLQEQP